MADDIDQTAHDLAKNDPEPLPDKGAPAADPLAAANDKIDAVSAKLVEPKKAEMAANEKVYGQVEGSIDRTLPRLEQMWRKEGDSIGAVKPWNADAERAKRTTDPITAMSSFGSVFGIIASSFTRAPMTNGLNAMAASINAIKDGDDKAYESAYKAWQDNTKLALDREKIQHEAYQDGIALMSTNMAAAKAKLQVTAARFGDEKTLALLDAGMDKEVIETMAARQKLAISMAEAQPKIWLENEKMRDLISDPRYKLAPGDPKRAEMIREWNQRWSPYGARAGANPLAEFTTRFFEKNPNATTDEYKEALGDFIKTTGVGAKGGGGNTTLTPDRAIAADVTTMVDKFKKDNPGATPEEIAQYRADKTKELKTRTAAPSGNRVDDIKAKQGQIQLARTTIKHIEETLAKHKAITGLGGAVTRPGEVIGNIFGSNETDRKQFERWVNELQEIAPRILLDSKGRPLSAEASRIGTIIAGLKLGDTGANTVRAYREFEKVLDQIDKMAGERIGGAGAATPATSSGAAKTAPWLRDPVVAQ